MTIGALIFWLFIGLPILGTVLWWIIMLVCAPFMAAGAGAQAVKENRQDKRQRAIDAEMKKLDEQEKLTSAVPGGKTSASRVMARGDKATGW